MHIIIYTMSYLCCELDEPCSEVRGNPHFFVGGTRQHEVTIVQLEGSLAQATPLLLFKLTEKVGGVLKLRVNVCVGV